jgi:hypothetical protein
LPELRYAQEVEVSRYGAVHLNPKIILCGVPRQGSTLGPKPQSNPSWQRLAAAALKNLKNEMNDSQFRQMTNGIQCVPSL